MKDFELSHGLALLADEAEPAAVDVYDVITKAKARTRNRRATVATSLGVITVAGAMITTISLGAGQPSTQAGSQSATPPVTAWSPPAGPTMTSHALEDDQMTTFTNQLAEAWPSIVPQGVTTEKLDWFASGTLGPLEFRGFRTELPPNSITYAAAAELTYPQGSLELLIHVTKVNPGDWPFASLDNSAPDSTNVLPDGTRMEIRTRHVQRVTQLVRPDGTAIKITENNLSG